MMQKIFDVAVVGAGPAGLSAALNASIRNKRVIVLGPETSEKLNKAERIDNYLGIAHISGEALLSQFRRQVEERETVTFYKKNVQMIYDMGDFIGLLLPENEMIEAKAVVIATGISFGQPIPGEETYLGKGVGTCATCDAALYKNRPVVVIGYQKSAAEEANFISETASDTQFVNMTGGEVSLSSRVKQWRGRPLRIRGDDVARSLILETEEGERELLADGFFFLRDARKPDRLVPGLLLNGSHIQVNEKMETNLPGIFAAGDCVRTPYQINAAVGMGQIAGLYAAQYATSRDHQ